MKHQFTIAVPIAMLGALLLGSPASAKGASGVERLLRVTRHRADLSQTEGEAHSDPLITHAQTFGFEEAVGDMDWDGIICLTRMKTPALITNRRCWHRPSRLCSKLLSR